jgi:hypothetical protein
MHAQVLTSQFSMHCLYSSGNRPALQGRRSGESSALGLLRRNQMLPGSFEGRPAAKIAACRSEERRRGREGVWPKARAGSAGRERAEEASDR